jgi:hypothetical protein
VCGEGGGASVSVLFFVFIIVHYIISCLFVYWQLLYEYMTCLVSCIVINGREMR